MVFVKLLILVQVSQKFMFLSTLSNFLILKKCQWICISRWGRGMPVRNLNSINDSLTF